FLGLTGNWGTSIAGRLVAPRHGFLASIDPFGAGTVGQYRNVYSDVGFHGDLIDAANNAGIGLGVLTLADVDRVDNAIAYVSPSFGGFNITAAYATQAIGQEGGGIGYGGTIDNDGDAKVIALLPRYTNGPLDVGLSYQRIKVDEATPALNPLGPVVIDSDAKITQWTIGGAYDFKVVKLGAYYDRYKGKLSADLNANAAGNLGLGAAPYRYDVTETLKTWLIGATIPFGKQAIQVSYSQSKFDPDAPGVSAGKAKQWAVGYTYALSKRTNFYAAYSDINNDNEKDNKPNKVSRGASVGDASNGGGGYQRGIQFGLKHTFYSLRELNPLRTEAATPPFLLAETLQGFRSNTILEGFLSPQEWLRSKPRPSGRGFKPESVPG
ncbi:MAG: porin, partial [Zoogloeaceae bacterium]|nr:porin [Zoogloeaceae bacterium]